MTYGVHTIHQQATENLMRLEVLHEQYGLLAEQYKPSEFRGSNSMRATRAQVHAAAVKARRDVLDLIVHHRHLMAVLDAYRSEEGPTT